MTLIKRFAWAILTLVLTSLTLGMLLLTLRVGWVLETEGYPPGSVDWEMSAFGVLVSVLTGLLGIATCSSYKKTTSQ